MKRSKRTDLDLWLFTHGETNASFAEKLSTDLGEKVPASTVGKWRLGIMTPRAIKIGAIARVTDGDVNVQSFVAAAEEKRRV
jgi:hypothetical protein